MADFMCAICGGHCDARLKIERVGGLTRLFFVDTLGIREVNNIWTWQRLNWQLFKEIFLEFSGISETTTKFPLDTFNFLPQLVLKICFKNFVQLKIIIFILLSLHKVFHLPWLPSFIITLDLPVHANCLQTNLANFTLI